MMLTTKQGSAKAHNQSKLVSAAKDDLAARCWKGASPRYRYLLQDQDIKRWYDNVCRGSKITADVYLRRVGSLCSAWGMKSPIELLERARNGDGRWDLAELSMIGLVTR